MDAKPKSIPFSNKGLMLKADPAQIPEGQYAVLTNMVSVQEGNIAVRGGCAVETASTTFPTSGVGAPLIHTITKLKQTAAGETVYIGEDGNLWSNEGSGNFSAFTKIASGLAPNGASYAESLIGSDSYYAGEAATPYGFFGSANAMLKDNGSFTAAQKWGISPPTVPAIASVGATNILPTTDLIAAAGSATRLAGPPTVSSFSVVSAGVYQITPSSMVGIIPGMLVVVGTLLGRVQSTTSTTFNIYLTSAPTTGNNITSGEATVASGGSGSTYAATINAAFNGVASDGYSTLDPVHISLNVVNPIYLTDLRLRVLVNGSASDYYEKAIAISSIQSQTSLTETAIASLQQTAALLNQNVYGDFDNAASGEFTQAKPQTLLPISPVSPTNPVWTEIDTPKSSFVAVGNAGSGLFTWQNVTGFQVIYTSSGGSPTVLISSLYIMGGLGPLSTSGNAQAPLQPYNYVFTYVNPLTGAESNPSQPIITANEVNPVNEEVLINVFASTDPQVTGANSINIYRQGGSFTDDFFRLVGSIANPTATATVSAHSRIGLSNAYIITPTSMTGIFVGVVILVGTFLVTPYAITATTFTANFYGNVPSNGMGITLSGSFSDSVADIDIASSNTALFDQDAPITRNLPIPMQLAFEGWITASGTPGLNVVAVTILSGPSLTNLAEFLTVGTAIQVNLGAQSYETCVVMAVNAASTSVYQNLTLFFQNDQSATQVGALFAQTGSVANGTGNLVLQAFDSMFVAGDAFNPHVLYKSKTGRPETFPVIDEEAGTANQINVGTPSNPIKAFTEFQGGILCLNSANLFFVGVFAGAMETPQKTPAQRGLLATRAWCVADNEIWYLAYDGIYSWAGGQSVWRTEAIDPLFKGVAIGPYAPVNLTPNLGNSGADIINFEYSDNEILVSYRDVNGLAHRMRYHTKFNRWSIDNYGDGASTAANPTWITAQYNDRESGQFLIAQQVVTSGGTFGFVYQDATGTTDNGAAIAYAHQQMIETFSEPTMQKQFLDMVVETGLLGSTATLKLYYDFSTIVDPVDQFTLSTTTRQRQAFSLQGGYGKECYAAQMYFSGSSSVGGVFYSLTYNVFPLAQIQSGRTPDWDDLGYPYDKRIYQLVVTYNVTASTPVIMNLDTISGIADNLVELSAVQQFTLSPGPGTGLPARKKANFTLTDGIICKLVRVRPNVATTPFKYFDYSFPEFTKYPADIVTNTEWSDEGYPCEKTLKSLTVELNTGGVNCLVQIQGDGADMLTDPITINTTPNDRKRILTLTTNPNLTAKMYRLIFTPGTGGMSQYFSHNFDFFREPCAVYHWDSFEFNFGYDGFSFIKQVWLQYWSTQPITVTFYVADDQQFYQVTLPAHPYRDVERFYLPDGWLNGGVNVLNKSKVHRMTIDSYVPVTDPTGAPFRLYQDGSRVEWMPCGADMRSAYQQQNLTTMMNPSV